MYTFLDTTMSPCSWNNEDGSDENMSGSNKVTLKRPERNDGKNLALELKTVRCSSISFSSTPVTCKHNEWINLSRLN